MENYGKVSGVSRVSLAEQVYQNLVAYIANGDLPAGTELKEQHLAKQMGVSATPVREALRRLASDGMVETVPYHGAVVRTLNHKEIEEAYACREVLEHLAISEAITHLTDKDIDYLYSLKMQAEYRRFQRQVSNLMTISMRSLQMRLSVNCSEC